MTNIDTKNIKKITITGMNKLLEYNTIEQAKSWDIKS